MTVPILLHASLAVDLFENASLSPLDDVHQLSHGEPAGMKRCSGHTTLLDVERILNDLVSGRSLVTGQARPGVRQPVPDICVDIEAVFELRSVAA